MVGTSTWSSVLGAPDSTVGTRQRPVDGHLPSKEEVPVHRITDLFARPVRHSEHPGLYPSAAICAVDSFGAKPGVIAKMEVDVAM